MLKKQLLLFGVLVLVLPGLLLAGCANSKIEPQAIDPTIDICTSCKMSIVDMHFAAQCIDGIGQPINFDDIGCMALYIRRLGPGGEQGLKAIYVKDFNTTEWLPAKEAHYVQGRINTPMNFGIIALAREESARDFAKRIGGKELTWEEVLVAKQTVGLGDVRQGQDGKREDRP